jgi:ATP-dependent Lon protease
VIVGHEHMLGNPVELVPTLHLPRRRASLIAEFPYAVDVIDFILGDLVSKPTVTIRPVLLTGTPGSGKTHFARRFAHHFGLHLWSVDCSSADGSVFAGTDRRWYSAEPSHPFLAMSQGRMGNPLVILDELEKSPTRQDYGRMWDGLLPFLDPGSNKAIQDKALQVAVDCSHVNYIATVNRLDPLPWPLRDRLRVIAFPEPTAVHLEALIPPLMAELATSRSLDPRFIEPLTEEDRAFLARRWKGGSVRRLARMLEAIINARERSMPLH